MPRSDRLSSALVFAALTLAWGPSLLAQEPRVRARELRLFRSNPFATGPPPTLVRTVRWQYWSTDLAPKRRTGAWWRRRELGAFTGVVGRR